MRSSTHAALETISPPRLNRVHQRAPAAPLEEPLEFLAGGGDIGATIRTSDWSSSSLGSPERWPRSLRNALRLVLAATHPMVIFWGPDQLEFPNDALVRLLNPTAGPHQVVGGRARESRRDIWPILGPLLEAVIVGGESRVLDDHLVGVFRHGYVEEIYLTIRLDPIPGDMGGVGGVLGTVTDTTHSVISRRRAAALRALESIADNARAAEEAGRRVLVEISRYPSDTPFALLYLREPDGAHARLIATASLPAGAAASPERIELEARAGSSGWPVPEALKENRPMVVDDLTSRFGTLPAGDWPIAPRSAVVLPLVLGGESAEGALIAGVSARRGLDDDYYRFLQQVGQRVAKMVLAGKAYETQQAEAAAAASKLARALRRTQERALEARFAAVLEERTRLAREIHDTLLQGFTGVGLQLVAATSQVTGSPGAIAALRDVLALAQKTLRDARSAVWDLRASERVNGDFLATLRSTAEEATRGAGVALDFQVTGRPRTLLAAVEAILGRVAQEAIANVVKHAAARTIRLTVAYGTKGVRLSVVDDGQGFVVDRHFRSYGGHWGLLGMQERATGIGAKLLVRSAPERGTEIVLRVPYAPTRRLRDISVSAVPSDTFHP
jgi:signal transduction histidine kinase